MNFDITRGNLIVTQVQLDILNIVVRTCINIYLVEKCCKRMYFSYATRRNAENFNDTERERERERDRYFANLSLQIYRRVKLHHRRFNRGKCQN